MRGIGNHKPPANTQPVPFDNRIDDVKAQVQDYLDTGIYVHPEIAREIAAWWQAPSVIGLPFTKFAGTGTIDEDLPYSIRFELARTQSNDDGRDGLYALHSYINAALLEMSR
jgi:hypothetical protein